ncbi:putative Tail Collar domain protein [Vibrio nigripulchritudo SOn1]|uniref:Tail Collar domain protein n=1 Tax=Vibrio nigripulchritudo SOn1 TaxID=1238450 RepID=A0AAV2VN89_9VIBR|nr:tail fiber protein [Vibrio nigripulchritudo]CCO46180.1 putative Tail Collar domain protein [Vibrio nigripulchritudo SOn1]
MEPFIGQVMMFAGNYAPKGWALCDGELLSISDYPALFSVIGDIYGGDGVKNFALPDLQGRAPVGQGKGHELSHRVIGQSLGQEEVSLHVGNLPSHSTQVSVSIDIPVNTGAGNEDETNPSAGVLANNGVDRFASDETIGEKYAGKSIIAKGKTLPIGNNLPVDIIQPSLVMNYIIALDGIYPARE